MKDMKKNELKKIVLAALFLALAYTLPFLTGQIPQIGKMLCPMHFPVLLCGFMCGPLWGLMVGFISPLLRSLTLGVPVFYPSALCMAFELAAYGACAALIFKLLPKNKLSVYIALLAAMIFGRIVWGGAMFLCMGIAGTDFGIKAFLAGALLNALPGIVLQILIIPPLVMALCGMKRKAYEN